MLLVATNVNFVLNWSSYMGILPFYTTKNRQFSTSRAYSYGIIAFLLLAFLHFVLSGIFNNANDKTSVFIFGTLTTVASTLTSVYSIYGSTSWNLMNIQTLFDTFNAIDSNVISIHHIDVPEIRFINVVFTLINLFMFALIAYELYISCFVQNIAWYFFKIGSSLQMYYLVITVVLQFYILHSIQRRFSLVNTAIEKLELPFIKFVDLNKSGDLEKSQKVENLIKLHNKACDLVDIFNDVFGWQLLLTIFYTFLNNLMTIDFVLSEEDYSKKINNLILTSITTVFLVALEVALAVKCEFISREGKASIAISYKTLIRYMNVQCLKGKLFVLAQQTTTRCPILSAAGFFDVNYAMLFMLVNLLTTYVIVIIQFLPTK